jgi:hypothetical protein
MQGSLLVVASVLAVAGVGMWNGEPRATEREVSPRRVTQPNKFTSSATIIPSGSNGLPPPVNPFCATTSHRDDFELAIACDPATGGTIDQILFASYGTLVASCPSPQANASCSANITDAVQRICHGTDYCTIKSSAFPDPCGGVVKSLTVVAHCTGSGGFPITIVPSCVLSNFDPPCPLPSERGISMEG